MIVNFATKVLGKEPELERTCVFTDILSETAELQQYAIDACQFGIMGLRGDGSPADIFNPNNLLDKAQYSTMLSRLIYGEINNSETCWYCNHVDVLYRDGIITSKENLTIPFLR